METSLLQCSPSLAVNNRDSDILLTVRLLVPKNYTGCDEIYAYQQCQKEVSFYDWLSLKVTVYISKNGRIPFVRPILVI